MCNASCYFASKPSLSRGWSHWQALLLGVSLRASLEGPSHLRDRYGVLCLQMQKQLQTQLHADGCSVVDAGVQLSSTGFRFTEKAECTEGARLEQTSQDHADRLCAIQDAITRVMEAASISFSEASDDRASRDADSFSH